MTWKSGANSTIDRGSLDDTRIAEGREAGQSRARGAQLSDRGAHGDCGPGRIVRGLAYLESKWLWADRRDLASAASWRTARVIGGQSGVLGGKTIRSGETVWGTPARSLQKFKELFAWYGRLPELAARIKGIEEKLGGK